MLPAGLLVCSVVQNGFCPKGPHVVRINMKFGTGKRMDRIPVTNELHIYQCRKSKSWNFAYKRGVGGANRSTIFTKFSAFVRIYR